MLGLNCGLVSVVLGNCDTLITSVCASTSLSSSFEQEKKDLEDCIPKATRDATKWVYKVF